MILPRLKGGVIDELQREFKAKHTSNFAWQRRAAAVKEQPGQQTGVTLTCACPSEEGVRSVGEAMGSRLAENSHRIATDEELRAGVGAQVRWRTGRHLGLVGGRRQI